MNKIPAFIINRNLLTWPKAMVEWLYNLPDVIPVIIDNNSDYKPLLDWYETQPCNIIRLDANLGHMAFYYLRIIEQLTVDYYIIADPDFDMSTVPLDLIGKLKDGLERYPEVSKAGVAIRIDDMPDEFPVKQQVIEWESPFWTKPLGDDFYDADIDTTFALYDRRRSQHHLYSAVRVGGEYTARHLPFYITPDTMNEELLYYFDNSDKNISTMARFLEPLIESYRESLKPTEEEN